MRKSILIGGALVAGIILILGSFYVSQKNKDVEEGEVVQVPIRNTLETEDLNGNGIADWKESLEGLAFETIETPTTTSISDETDEYIPPTTFTGKFAVAFLRDYLSGKSKGVSFENPDDFIGTAVEAIERNVESKKHSRLELNIVESTEESLRDYGNTLVLIVRSSSVDSNEDVFILSRALQEDDPDVLDELTPIKDAYSKTIIEMLRMDVPSELVEVHIELVNAYEAMYSNLEAMQYIMSDPLYALAKIRTYIDDSEKIVSTVKTIADILTKNGIVYRNYEPGSQLYLFDT